MTKKDISDVPTVRETVITKIVKWMVSLRIIMILVLAARASNLLSGTAVVAATIPNNADTVNATCTRAARSLLHTTE
jgi:hypothetical protein